MGDFYLDCRPREQRKTALAADRLKHFNDVRITVLEERNFSAVIAREDDEAVWGHCRTAENKVTVMLAGRIALDAQEWEAARGVGGEGGVACKAIFQKYASEGEAALKTFNGNFTAIIHDGRDGANEKLFIVTDRAGFAPAFRADDPVTMPVFASNADLLAAATGVWDELDFTSLAEVLCKACVSFPHTHYRGVKGLQYGAVTKISFAAGGGVRGVTTTPYYEFTFDGGEDADRRQEELADEFAAAFKNSVRRRTQPEMGASFVALSGGLDSRTVLSASPPGTASFSFFDEENFESGIAEQIAKALGSKHYKLKRRPDHYAETAPAGVRMEGGMGHFLANLYLGFRDELKSLGMGNFLSGCYCDYQFKALLLNKRIRPFLRSYEFSEYRPDFYLPFLTLNSREMAGASERIEAIVPVAMRNKSDNATMFQIETRRVLPFSYEPDLRGTIQRVMRWSAITSDNDMLDVWRRIPYRLKINNRIFHKMMERVCPPEVLKIWDSNVGAPVNASAFGEFVGRWRRVVAYQIEKRRKNSLATSGSAPNWGYYFTHSKKMQELWFRPNALATEVLTRIYGANPFEKPIEFWVEQGNLVMLIRLMTLKIWFDVRIRAENDPGAQWSGRDAA